MIRHPLASQIKITRGTSDVAAGTGNVTAGRVDMTGFKSVCCFLFLGIVSATAVPGLKAQQSSDDGATDDWTDIAGSENLGTATDDDKIMVCDINAPSKRWVRFLMIRNTANVQVDGSVIMQYNGDVVPVDHDSTVFSPVVQLHNAPEV